MSDEDVEKFAEEAYERQRAALGSHGMRSWSELGPLSKERLIGITKAYFASVGAAHKDNVENSEEPE